MIEGEPRREDSLLAFPVSERGRRFLEFASFYMVSIAVTRGLHYIVNARWFAENTSKIDATEEYKQESGNIYKGMGVGLIAFIGGLSSPFLIRGLKLPMTHRAFLGKTALAAIGFAGGMMGNLSDGDKYKDAQSNSKSGFSQQIQPPTTTA